MKCYDMSSSEIKELYRANPKITTAAEFEQALSKLGVKAGMQLVVHSSLGSLGSFEGGAENYCKVLQKIVTEEGTLMMPGLVRYPGNGVECTYIPESSPVAVGIVPETFRQMPGVVRSWDPTHSFCVWGRDKIEFVRGHHLVSTMDKDSPLGLLEQAGGYCLAVGCYHNVTFMHVVETSCGAPCLGERTEEHNAVIHGKLVKMRGWGWRNGKCRALQYDRIYDSMREQGALSETMLGHSHLVLFPLSAYRKAYSALLADPEIGCAGCSILPRVVDRTVPSDWLHDEHRRIPGKAFDGEYSL